MSQQERVLVDMTVGAPADDVWAALREPDRLRRWFGWDDAGLEAEIRQIFHEQAVADDDARTLSWPDGDRFEVTGEGDGSRLRVLRTGHTPGAWDGVHDPVDEGWITFAQQLRFLLERHRDQDRRTLSEHDVDLGPDEDPLLARLGLRDLGDEPVGDRYTVQRPDGSSFSGEIFFQTDLQLGLTVDEEGDALLVVTRTPPSTAPPNGRGSFVLSLFDADDARVAEAEGRWRSWWSS